MPLLTGENYTAWSIKVEANLDAAGLWEAVVVPEDAAAAVITKKDKPARAYLLGALAEDLLLQVAAKKTAAEVWAALKARLVGADHVRATRLGTLRGEFELLRMASGDTLDEFAGKLGGMAARYAALGSTLEDAALVKKLLDSVPNRLYAAVAGIEQFCDVSTMPFEEALRRLKAFDEWLRRRGQADGERADGASCSRRRSGERASSVGAVCAERTMTTGRAARRRASAGTGAAAATSAANAGISSASARNGRRRRRRSGHCWWTALSRTPGCSEPRLRARVLG